MARGRLADLEQRLQAAGFLRIHRSVLINLACLHELRGRGQGGYEFLLDGGERFISSIGYREQVQKALDMQQRNGRR